MINWELDEVRQDLPLDATLLKLCGITSDVKYRTVLTGKNDKDRITVYPDAQSELYKLLYPSIPQFIKERLPSIE